MKVLLTGLSGQLGFDVMRALKAQGMEVHGFTSRDMDITKKETVSAVFKRIRPDICIHTAAWTKVDLAEEKNKEAYEVNVTGTENIASACAETGSSLIYFSTDYVFNGMGSRPWKPEDEVQPLNYYGTTKYEGELKVREILPEKHFILRLEWIYGINGKNFVKTMLNLSKTHTSLRVVNDQIGSPTYTYDVAGLVLEMIMSEKYGTYHVANTGYCSWYDFAREIFKLSGLDVKVEGVSSADYPTRAKRPLNSRFDTLKLKENGFSLLPSWQDALSRFMKELGY